MANLLFSSYCVYQKVGMRYLSETTLCLPLLYYTFGKRDIIGMVCLHLNRKDFHFIREIILLFPNQIQIRSRCTYPPTIKANKHTSIVIPTTLSLFHHNIQYYSSRKRNERDICPDIYEYTYLHFSSAIVSFLPAVKQ